MVLNPILVGGAFTVLLVAAGHLLMLTGGRDAIFLPEGVPDERTLHRRFIYWLGSGIVLLPIGYADDDRAWLYAALMQLPGILAILGILRRSAEEKRKSGRGAPSGGGKGEEE